MTGFERPGLSPVVLFGENDRMLITDRLCLTSATYFLTGSVRDWVSENINNRNAFAITRSVLPS